MKSFDLKAALAGHPVVTRDGRPVKIAAYDKDAFDYCKLIGWIDGKCESWSDAGEWSNEHTMNDIFIVPEKKWLVMIFDENRWIIHKECDYENEAEYVLSTLNTGIKRVVSIELH